MVIASHIYHRNTSHQHLLYVDNCVFPSLSVSIHPEFFLNLDILYCLTKFSQSHVQTDGVLHGSLPLCRIPAGDRQPSQQHHSRSHHTQSPRCYHGKVQLDPQMHGVRQQDELGKRSRMMLLTVSKW